MYAKEMLITHRDFLKRENERLQKHLIELESQIRDIKIDMKNNERDKENIIESLKKLGE